LHVCGVYQWLVNRWSGTLMRISRYIFISYLCRMIYQHSARMRGNWLNFTWTLVLVCLQIDIKLNINLADVLFPFESYGITLITLRRLTVIRVLIDMRSILLWSWRGLSCSPITMETLYRHFFCWFWWQVL
jgi:hypothetical protein